MPSSRDIDTTALAAILSRWNAGDPAAPAEALEAVRPWMRNRVERLGARSGSRALDADDLVQEAHAAANRALSTVRFETPRELLAWASTIASNKVRDRMRARAREPRDETPADEALEANSATAVPDALAVDLVRESWRGFCRSAEDVGGTSRRVVVMRRGLGVDWDVAAFVSARMVAATRSIYYRAREALHEP